MTILGNFPVGIHILTIPLVLALGFLLGWLARGAATPPRRPPPPGGSGSPPDETPAP